MKKTISILLLLACLLTAPVSACAEAGQMPIDEASAKAVALGHAGLEENSVASLIIKADREDGKDIYEVEFWNGPTEYDYDIDADSGEILSFDIEVKGTAVPKPGEAPVSPISELTAACETAGISKVGKTVTPEKALAIAFEKAGVSEPETKITEVAVKYNAKTMKTKYSFEFTVGSMEYEVEVDAADGVILEYDFESDGD